MELITIGNYIISFPIDWFIIIEVNIFAVFASIITSRSKLIVLRDFVSCFYSQFTSVGYLLCEFLFGNYSLNKWWSLPCFLITVALSFNENIIFIHYCFLEKNVTPFMLLTDWLDFWLKNFVYPMFNDLVFSKTRMLCRANNMLFVRQWNIIGFAK